MERKRVRLNAGYWKNKSYQRSFSQQLVAGKNFSIQEISPDIQIHKIMISAKKVERRIKKLINEKYRVKDEERKEIEKKILHLEGILATKLLKASLLERRCETQIKRLQTKYENEKKREEIVKKNIQKIKPKKTIDKNKPEYSGLHLNPEDKKYITINKQAGPRYIPKRYKRFSKY